MLSHFSHTFRTRIEFLQMKAQSSLLSIYNPPNHHFLHTPISHFPKTTKNNNNNNNMTCKIHSPQSNPLSQFYDPFATLRRPPDFQIRIPVDTNWPEKVSVSDIWSTMRHEARLDVEKEPVLSEYYSASILSHDTMESALSDVLSTKLGDRDLPRGTLRELFMGVMGQDEEIIWAVGCDLVAVKERDPACMSYVHCFLNFKGFLACQAHRIAHRLWSQGRKTLALIIQSRVSESFAVDIHPGARIGRGILLDHATGLVVGETAVVGDDVAILHNVTLGGTGKMCGDRHPKIGDGVLIGAGTCVLGNVRIGEGAKVGAGSVVLKEVPPRTTAVGNPARLIGGRENPVRLDEMPSLTMDHTSDISEWSDYVI